MSNIKLYIYLHICLQHSKGQLIILVLRILLIIGTNIV